MNHSLHSILVTDQPLETTRGRAAAGAFRSPGRGRRQRRGVASVEFALVASTLFLILFGCLEFSKMILLRNLAQDAAYEAARYCMVEGATTSEAVAKANEVLAMMNTRGAVISINNGSGITTTSTDILVTIRIPMENNSILFKPIFANRFIDVGSSLRRERYDGYYSGG